MNLDSGKGGHTVEFSQPTRQIFLMLSVLICVSLGITILASQIQAVILANPYLNAFIFAVFLLGVGATFWQVSQLITATNWLREIQAGTLTAENAKPPRLVASMAPIVRDGKVSGRLAASTTRTVLDSIAVRLDEARDITRYITNLLIFLGLLGTFWGLSLTVPAVVDTIRSLAPSGAGGSNVSVFERLMSGLEDQLGGMGTAFASSLVGLAGSLIVGLLELFAGHGQNRFYRELEEWLGGFTRLGLVSEGEGPDGALVALLERVDEGLERTSQSAQKAEDARVASEQRLGQAADVVAAMAGQFETQSDQIAALVSEMRAAREHDQGLDRAILSALKRLEQTNGQIAQAQLVMAEAIGKGGAGAASGTAGVDSETRTHVRNMEKQLRLMAQDVSSGRQESTTALRSELRALINLIDARTRATAGLR